MQTNNDLNTLQKELSETKEKERKYKLALNILRDSEQRYRNLFDILKDAYFVSKPDGEILDINPAGVQMLGYQSREDFLKIHNLNNLYQNPRNLDRYYQLMESQGFVKDFELILKRKDGLVIFALVTAISVKDKKGTVVEYRGIISDDTEGIKNECRVKRMDVELMLARQELEEYKKQKIDTLPLVWDLYNIGVDLGVAAGDIVNNLNILKTHLKTVSRYILSLEWLTNHIQDYDETIFLVKEIEKVQELRKSDNIDYIIKDSDTLFENTLKSFEKISTIISLIKKL